MSEYEKIKALIFRNDFTTAEKLMEKRGAALAEEEQEALRKLIAERQRENAREFQKSVKRLRSANRRGRHWRVTMPLEIGLARCMLAGSVVFVPYFKNKFYSWPKPFELQGMEVLLLLYLLLTVLFLGLAFMDAHRNKIYSQEAKRRAEKRKDDTLPSFRAREKADSGEERNWLLALLCAAAFALAQAVHVVRML